MICKKLCMVFLCVIFTSCNNYPFQLIEDSELKDSNEINSISVTGESASANHSEYDTKNDVNILNNDLLLSSDICAFNIESYQFRESEVINQLNDLCIAEKSFQNVDIKLRHLLPYTIYPDRAKPVWCKYSPDGNNRVYAQIEFENIENEANLPEILLFVNDEKVIIYRLLMPYDNDYQFDSVNWISNNLLLINGNVLYNVESPKLKLINMPYVLCKTDYKSNSEQYIERDSKLYHKIDAPKYFHASANPSGTHIAYSCLHDSTINILIYCLEDETWQVVYNGFRGEGKPITAQLVWKDDEILYFGCRAVSMDTEVDFTVQPQESYLYMADISRKCYEKVMLLEYMAIASGNYFDFFDSDKHYIYNVYDSNIILTIERHYDTIDRRYYAINLQPDGDGVYVVGDGEAYIFDFNKGIKYCINPSQLAIELNITNNEFLIFPSPLDNEIVLRFDDKDYTIIK